MNIKTATASLGLSFLILGQIILPYRVMASKQSGEIKKVAKHGTYVPGEIIIKYKASKINLRTSAGRAVASNFNQSKFLEKRSNLANGNAAVLKIKDSKTVEEKIVELKNDSNVEYVEPNYRRHISGINTDDMNRDLLWGLDNVGQTVSGYNGVNDADIDAPEAWAISEGGTSSIIVAIIDTGVAYNHPDLIDNMWDGANCKDESGGELGGCNHGYDFLANDKTPLSTDSSHGTHVAGTIAAAKNNAKGIIGVAPNAKIMALKFGLDTASEIRAIDFAIKNGAKVVNASFIGSDYSQAEFDAINRFRDAGGIFVAAAGNNTNNNDMLHGYPSDYNLDNIISVAATNQDDSLASFSNYGTTTVDVGAPGVNIYSTMAGSDVLNETFESLTPTSTPVDWIKGGVNNKWGTYNIGTKVLFGQTPGSPFDGNVDTYIDSSAVNIGGANGATISFTARCDTEYITNGWADYMQLEYSADGIIFSTTSDPYFEGEFRWDEPTFDILNNELPVASSSYSAFRYSDISIPSQYLTNDFKFRFRWVTNATDNNYAGCSVDDIVITKYGDGADEQYGFMSGTSMAAPHVAGLAALIVGYNPGLTLTQLRHSILDTGDSLPSLLTSIATGRRVNAQKALMAVNPTKMITSFTIPGQVGSTTINEALHSIALTVPFGTNVASLTPVIIFDGAMISSSSNVSKDFTLPVIYIVTATDGSNQSYVVTVLIEPNPDLIFAQPVVDLIEALPLLHNLRLNDVATVAATRVSYDSLLSGQQVLVSNYSTLVVSENQLGALATSTDLIIVLEAVSSGDLTNELKLVEAESRVVLASTSLEFVASSTAKSELVSRFNIAVQVVVSARAAMIAVNTPPPVVSSGGGGYYIAPIVNSVATITPATTTKVIVEPIVIKPINDEVRTSTVVFINMAATNMVDSKKVIAEEKVLVKKDIAMVNRLKGQILIQVENKGQAWYVNPDSGKKYFLGRPVDAFDIMRGQGLGVKNSIIKNNKVFYGRFLGRILIDVEDRGKAYYVNSKDKKAYYLGRPNDAFLMMSKLGLGISNANIRKIEVGE